MTKTEIQNAINSNLSIVITKAKVLLGLNNLTNELFNTPVIENTSGTLVITSQSTADITYNVAFIKQGNKVTCYGTFKNIGPTILSDVFFLSVTDLTLNPINLVGAGFVASSISSNILCNLVYAVDSPTGFKAVGAIETNLDYYFNFTYIIND